MRIIGFSEHWKKLEKPEYTTFRVPRKDTDWQLGERVQVVYRPRSKQREPLGIADIISKEEKNFIQVTQEEATADGFCNCLGMWEWLNKAHKGFRMTEDLNKLTLKWVKKDTDGG